MNIMAFGVFLAKKTKLQDFLNLVSYLRLSIQRFHSVHKISKFRLLAWHFEPQCSNKSVLMKKKSLH